MKRKLLLLFCFLTFENNLFAQNPLVKQWDYRFGGTDYDYLFSFQQTLDGGYILGGISYSGISGDKTQNTVDTSINIADRGDYWIIKIDSMGSKKWDKDFGGARSDKLFSIQQTKDGGYILGGTSVSDISGDKTQANWDTSAIFYSRGDYWIIKTDSLGIKQWDKRFGGSGVENFTSIEQTIDGGYILGGYSKSDISGDKTQSNWDTTGASDDYWIIKIDSLGNKQWDKVFGGTDIEWLFSLHQTVEGGYILGGTSFSGVSGDKSQPLWGNIADRDYWIVKIDSLGNKQWDKDFGGTLSDYLFYINQTDDKGYILGGVSYSGISGDKTHNSFGFSDSWVLKIDSVGNKQWDKDFGGNDEEDEFGNISKTSDGGYLLAETSYSPISGNKSENNLGGEQSWIVKIDSLGNKQWDKTIFTTGHDEIGLAIPSNDRCFVIVNYTSGGIGGYKTQPNWGTSQTYDYWIIKFCDTTSTTSINQILNAQLPFSIYPNPTNEILDLVLSNKEDIVITNLVGEIILRKTAQGKVELDVSFLSAGIYFIRAGNEVKEFVKE